MTVGNNDDSSLVERAASDGGNNHSSSVSHMGVIIGIVCATVVVALTIFALALMIYIRSRRRHSNATTEPMYDRMMHEDK